MFGSKWHATYKSEHNTFCHLLQDRHPLWCVCVYLPHLLYNPWATRMQQQSGEWQTAFRWHLCSSAMTMCWCRPGGSAKSVQCCASSRRAWPRTASWTLSRGYVPEHKVVVYFTRPLTAIVRWRRFGDAESIWYGGRRRWDHLGRLKKLIRRAHIQTGSTKPGAGDEINTTSVTTIDTLGASTQQKRINWKIFIKTAGNI